MTHTKDEAFLEWYKNAHWGNEDFKEGCHRSWNAAIKYTTPPAQPAPVQDLPFGVGGGLVAIKTLLSRDPCVHANTAIEMIDAILSAPAQPAPTSWMEMVTANLVREGVNKHKARELAEHFYGLAPASQRQWVGLTDEEIVSAIYEAEGFDFGLDNGNVSDRAVIEYVRIVEAKLKEKNT
jgi:hypothetical protein